MTSWLAFIGIWNEDETVERTSESRLFETWGSAQAWMLGFVRDAPADCESCINRGALLWQSLSDAPANRPWVETTSLDGLDYMLIPVERPEAT